MATMTSGDYFYAPMQSMNRTSPNTETKPIHSSYKYNQAQDRADHLKPSLPTTSPITSAKGRQSHVVRNLLEELNECKAQGIQQEFNNVTWEDFEKLDLDSEERVHSLRFDYDGQLQKLIVQFPSAIHESAVSAIAHEISKGRIPVEATSPDIARRWKFETAISTWYGDDMKEGIFVADGTFSARQRPVFYVEVAFSQSWPDIRLKVTHILQDKSILGVLVMNIEENPKWSGPKKKAVPDDIIDDEEWDKAVEKYRGKYPFHSFKLKEHVWVGSIKVDVCLFPKRWLLINPDPPRVLLKPQGESGTAFLDLDRNLQRIWKTVVGAVGGPEGSTLRFNWDLIRDQLLDGMYATAYDRYTKWCGKRKRKIDALEEGSEGGSRERSRARKQTSWNEGASEGPDEGPDEDEDENDNEDEGPSYPTSGRSFQYSSGPSFVPSSQGYLEHTEQVTHGGASQRSVWHSPSTQDLSSGRQPTSIYHPPYAQNVPSGGQPSSQMRRYPSAQNISSGGQPSSQMWHPPGENLSSGRQSSGRQSSGRQAASQSSASPAQNVSFGRQTTSQSFLHPPSAQNPLYGRQTDATFMSENANRAFPNSKNASSSRHSTSSTSTRRQTKN